MAIRRPVFEPLHVRELDAALVASALFLFGAALLPVAPDVGWPASLEGVGSTGSVALAALLASALALGLSGGASLAPLTKSGLALGLLAFDWVLLARDPALRLQLLPGAPPPHQTLAPLLMLALVLAGGASALLRRAEDEARVRPFAAVAIASAWLLVVVVYLAPLPRPAVHFIGDGLAAALGLELEPRMLTSMLVRGLVPLLPLVWLALATLQLSGKRTPALGWLVGLAAVAVATLAMRAPAALPVPTLVRAVLLATATLLAGGAAVAFGAAQLFDAGIPDGVPAGALLRDRLLGLWLARAPASPVRPALRTLTRARLAQLTEAWSGRGAVTARVRLQLAGDQEDEIARLDDSRAERLAAALPVRSSRADAWLAAPWRLETGALVALMVVAVAFAASERTPEDAREWTVGPAPKWAQELYADALPRIAVLAAGAIRPSDQATEAAVAHAVALATPAPDLQDAVRTLGAHVLAPGAEGRQLARAAERLNDAARSLALPYYLDLNVVTDRRRGYSQSYLHLKTYRIRRAEHALGSNGKAVATLFVERADATNLADGRLGFKKASQKESLVVVNAVRAFLLDELAPALLGMGAGLYRSQATELRGELVHALADATGTSDAVAAARVSLMLQCMASAAGDEDVWCASEGARTQEDVLELLGRMVQTHELQHAADGNAVPPPLELVEAMAGYAPSSVAVAGAELSAYLAEIARSPQPRLALTHLLSALAHPEAAEWFAATVAVQELGGELAEAEDVLALPTDEIRRRAELAYARLYGEPLAEPERPVIARR